MSIMGQRGRQRGRKRDNWNLMEKDYILRCLIVLFSILISQNLPLALFSELALLTICFGVSNLKIFYQQ